MKGFSVWIIFIAALMGEVWIMDSNKKFEPTGVIANALPAAVGDAEAVAARLREDTETEWRICEKYRSEGNERWAKHWQANAEKTAFLAYQATRLAVWLGKLNEQANTPDPMIKRVVS